MSELTFAKTGLEIRNALARRLPVSQAEVDDARADVEAAVAAAEADGYVVDRHGSWAIRDPSCTRNGSLAQAHMFAIAQAREKLQAAERDAEHTERLVRNLEGANLDRDYTIAETDLRRLGF